MEKTIIKHLFTTLSKNIKQNKFEKKIKPFDTRTRLKSIRRGTTMRI